eukprot:826378-Alexandrium_andersonii.AAC.1
MLASPEALERASKRAALLRAARACGRSALANPAAFQAPRRAAVLFQHSLGDVRSSRGLDSSRSRRCGSDLLRS